MKHRALLALIAGAGLLLGSARPPEPLPPLLPVDPAVFDADFGCPDGTGDACILLADGQGEIVLAGLPQSGRDAPAAPVAQPPERRLASRPAAVQPPIVIPASPVRVVISLPQQRAYVFRAGELVASAPVSTGRRGHPTPIGTFRILQKKVRHHSNLYSNAPMPFMQRLTNYGIALHAGHLPGYPASHGCIRLPWGFARKLYNMTDYGTRVTITRTRLRSAEEAASLV